MSKPSCAVSRSQGIDLTLRASNNNIFSFFDIFNQKNWQAIRNLQYIKNVTASCLTIIKVKTKKDCFIFKSSWLIQLR